MMAESRSAPRFNVVWRAAIALAPGKIVPAKIINFSQGGLKLECAHPLRDGEIYQMMMQVPSHRDASVRTQVICKVKCLYSSLGDNEYHVGMKYFDVPIEHTELIQSWSGLQTKLEVKQTVTPPINDLPNMV